MEKLEKDGWIQKDNGQWRNPSAPFVSGVSESDALKIQAMIDQWDQEEKYYPEDYHQEIRKAEIEKINRLSVQKIKEERFGCYGEPDPMQDPSDHKNIRKQLGG